MYTKSVLRKFHRWSHQISELCLLLWLSKKVHLRWEQICLVAPLRNEGWKAVELHKGWKLFASHSRCHHHGEELWASKLSKAPTKLKLSWGDEASIVSFSQSLNWILSLWSTSIVSTIIASYSVCAWIHENRFFICIWLSSSQQWAFFKPFIHNYLSHIKYKCLLTMTISFKIGKIVQVILIIGLFKWTNLSVTDRQWWFKHWYKNSWCELEKLIQWEDGRSWCKYRAYLVLHLFLSIFREQNIFWFYT